MRKIIQLLSVSFLLFACEGKFEYQTGDQAKQNEQLDQYVLGSDSIPIFSGLKYLKDQSTNFDTVTGNIVISSYRGNVKLEEVKYFYLGALPQLGWSLDYEEGDNLSYKRNNDKLEISLKQNGKKLFVKFFISSSI